MDSNQTMTLDKKYDFTITYDEVKEKTRSLTVYVHIQ